MKEQLFKFVTILAACLASYLVGIKSGIDRGVEMVEAEAIERGHARRLKDGRIDWSIIVKTLI